MSVCQKVKDLYRAEGVKILNAANQLSIDNAGLSKYLYRGPMTLKHLVQLADVAGYKLVLQSKNDITITVTIKDTGKDW